MRTRSTHRSRKSVTLLALAALSVAAVAAIFAIGGGTASDSARAAGTQERAAYLERVRDAVVHGAATDFAQGTGIGGPSFEACVKGQLREALDRPTIARLVAVYRRPYGTAGAAQALNALTAPLAARCGHRTWVPELVGAAQGLRSAAANGAVNAELGVTYGPYLGRRCHRPGPRNCDTIGIDVVFGRAATRVEAIAGSRTIRLRTPGQNTGIRSRDWVGTFTDADFGRIGKRHHGNVAYTAVELRVRFADGHRARALLPHVLVSPGWC
jgi:hypothetical protein